MNILELAKNYRNLARLNEPRLKIQLAANLKISWKKNFEFG